MAASVLWTIFYLFLLINISDAQQCIRGRSGGGLPPFRDYRGFSDDRIRRHHQAIIPSYKFDCNQMCGNITEWGVDVRPGGGGHQPDGGVPYTLDLQIWRPSPTVDDSTGTGCYSLVGNNRFTSISLDYGVASSLLPSPSDYIMFQPGDVLGVYVEEARGDGDGVVILTSFDGTTTFEFTSESVWYAIPSVTTSQNGDCPYSVGSNGVLDTLTQAAPVISISIVTFPCPPLSPMATTQPTPQPPNATTDSEETPPTTNQQTQEPVNPLTTDSTNGNTNGDIQGSEGATGTELRVPTTSETAIDLRSGNGNGLPSFEDTDPNDVGEDGSATMLGRRRQAIISSYKFDCTSQDLMCGNITEWGADLQPGGGMHNMVYTIDFQVWRPSPTVDDSTGTGCYSLVGNNRFTSIPLSDGVAQVTPSPQDYIMFRPGDVLGFYMEETRGDDDDDGVVVLTRPSSFTSELVWYASIAPTMATSQNGDCPYSVGSSGILDTLTRAAPVISVSTTTFFCPQPSSMATTQPTPQPPNPTTDSEETPGSIQSSQPRGPPNIGLIVIVIIIVVVSVLVITVVVVIAILLMIKKRHIKSTTIAVPTAANQAYGQNTHKGVEESIYKFPDPEVDTDDTIEAKQNVAYVPNTDVVVEVNEAYYATRIAIEGNDAYATNNITTEGNEAYATCIVTEGNQAYATSIATEKNAAYESVTTTGTADVYEVVR